MGPGGSGKSLVAAALAARRRARFIDGDDLHTRAQVSKMAGGIPLDDEDRRRWLGAVALALVEQAPLVVACAPLRREYRDRLRDAVPGLWFAELVPSAVPARRRVSRRDRLVPLDLADPRLVDPDESALLPLATDEAGARFAHDADLGAIVDRIAAVWEAQSLR